ncbi:MAG TPA: hypothetical protein VGP72_13605 [Planctomycetota bacterium]
MPEDIADDEDLARFLVQSNQFDSVIVSPAAFMPSKKDHETSVFRHGREPRQQLWEIGRIATGNRKLYGAAILKASAVRAALLDIVPDEPPDRHAVIRNWPWLENDPAMQKAQQKERAALLASAAGAPILNMEDTGA